MNINKSILIILLTPLINICNAQTTWELTLGSGISDMKGGAASYSHTRFPGPRIHAGAKVSGPIHWIEGLSWEAGLQYNYNKAGYYMTQRADTEDGENFYAGERIELDKSDKLYDRIRSLDLPVRLKYNAFGFLGILAGIQVSHSLKGDMYSSKSKEAVTERLHYYPLVALGEAGLFAPIGDKFEVSVSVVKGLSDRFYSSVDSNGAPNTRSQYYDLGFTVSLSYKVFPGKKSNSK